MVSKLNSTLETFNKALWQAGAIRDVAQQKISVSQDNVGNIHNDPTEASLFISGLVQDGLVNVSNIRQMVRAAKIDELAKSTDLMIGQTIHCSFPSQNVAELDDLNKIFNHWQKLQQFYSHLYDATSLWYEWNENIATYFTSGLKDSSADALSVPLTIEKGKVTKSTEDGNLSSYYSNLANWSIYGETSSEAARASDEVKTEASNNAVRSINSVVGDANGNKVFTRPVLSELSKKVSGAGQIMELSLIAISQIDAKIQEEFISFNVTIVGDGSMPVVN